MNSVERVHAALRLEQPDRVPVVEFLIDPKVAPGAVPGCRDSADCMDQLDMDGVACGANFRRVRENSDGNLYSLLDMIVSAGPDGINPIEPVAGMELKKVKELVGDRVCLSGNIDCGHLLPHGTPDEVDQAVRQAIADAGPGGGYIVSSFNSIHSSCNPQNLVAMVEACKRYEAYPLERES